MFVFIGSVHHTGTQFTQKLFEDIGYVGTDKTPKEAGNSCNYFHRCHLSDSIMTELNNWLHEDVPLIVPLRHPVEVMHTWLRKRDKPLEVMLRQWQILYEHVDSFKPLYLPMDHAERDRYFTNLRLKTDLKLITDWAVVGSKRAGSDHPAQEQPVVPEPEHIEMMRELSYQPFFERFYPTPWPL